MRRWRDARRRVVWSEPRLPPYVKINPEATDPDPEMTLQPGDLSMGAAAQDFLAADDPVDMAAAEEEADRGQESHS